MSDRLSISFLFTIRERNNKGRWWMIMMKGAEWPKIAQQWVSEKKIQTYC